MVDPAATSHTLRPEWLRTAAPRPGPLRATCALLDAQRVRTVCREARCPNRNECFANGTATFLVLGGDCTRRCRFCAVGWSSQAPEELDRTEPRRVAGAVVGLGLRHAVITSVTRDDLADGGACHVASVVAAIRSLAPTTTVEVLVSDMNGSRSALRHILAARPDVIAHNLETVPRLAPVIRPDASNRRSMELLASAASSRQCSPALDDGRAVRPLVKTGLMMGLGEEESEIRGVLAECARSGVDIVTIGQYLRPHPACVEVTRYVTPDEFDALERYGRDLGLVVQAGPLVRSSYHAAELCAAAASQGPTSRQRQVGISV